MKLNKKRKILIIILSVVIVAVILILIFSIGNKNSENLSGKSGGSSVEIVPLSSEQISILTQNVLSSEFIGDLPSKGIIGLQFYTFENGERVWQSGALIGKEGFLGSGIPDLVIIMHSKYIEELNSKDLCEVVQSAKANNDMWVESEISDAKLFLKYAGMMKYRNCFGF